MGSAVRTTYTYPALSPIRTLMPLLMCAYLTWLYKGKKKIWFTGWLGIGLLVSTLSVLWNLETGAGCALGFAAYVIIEQMQQMKSFGMKILGICVGMMCFCVLSILGAIGIVNGYNLFTGGADSCFSHLFLSVYHQSFKFCFRIYSMQSTIGKSCVGIYSGIAVWGVLLGNI